MRIQLLHVLLSLMALCPSPTAAATTDMASGAQSMTVLGADNSARACFHSASIAARRDYSEPEAIASCTRALEHSRLTDRDRMATFVNRGILYLAQRELDRAGADFDAAINLDPASGEVFVDRGNMAYMRHAYDAAISDYTRALELGLDMDHIAYFNRAMAQEHLRNFEGAKADYRRAMELEPEWFMPRVRLDSLMQAAAGQAND
jgi:tetratricopeptide (TPR) repeat protein